MRRFELHRDVDVSGLSGTGVVAEGVEFTDGTAVVRWHELDPDSPNYQRGVRATTVVFPNVQAVEALHGHAGATRLEWTDEEPGAYEPCDSEKHSWDHFRVEQVDSYWMRCHRVGPHIEHENSETGARWTDS